MKILYFSCVTLLIFSCTKKSSNGDETPTLAIQQTEQQYQTKLASISRDARNIGPAKTERQKRIDRNIYKISESSNELYGYYVGMFGKNKINVAIAEIQGDSIFGHSVCAGNFREIKGTIKKIGIVEFQVRMLEPGDDKYDGEFNFVLNKARREILGSWKPFKKVVSAKEFVLIKKEYEYKPSYGLHADASERYLDILDVENLLPEEIEIVRNAIYARHGYSFKNIKIRRKFDTLNWYIPMSTDIRDQLTEIEVVNIDLLYNYEDYYEEYYDEYGR